MENEKVYEIKKPNVFQKIKNWWKYSLTQDDRDIIKISGIWFVDGIIWGTAIATGVCASKAKKASNVSAAAGYIQGKMDAYKEMAQNPYGMMDAGMRKLEQQGKAKRF